METSIKRVVDARFVRRDGTCIVFIKYQYSTDKKTFLNTGIAIPPQYWDRKEGYISRELPGDYGDANELNINLRRMFRVAEDLLMIIKKNHVPNPGAFAKSYFNPSLSVESIPLIEQKIHQEDVNKNLDIFFQLDQYIKSKTNKVTPDVLRVYRNLKTYLLAFQEYQRSLKRNNYKITFENLDFNFYEDFIDYLTYQWTPVRRSIFYPGLKTNTVGRVIKDLKAFIADRVRKKIIRPVEMSEWTVLQEEIDAIYLNQQEIEKISMVDLSGFPHLSSYRDDFILGCMTGLRFSDFTKINTFDIRGDFLYKKQQKSFHWVVIPLRHAAKQILERRFENKVRPPSNPEFNRHIKTIARLAGISDVIEHSHKIGNKVIVESRPKHDWVCSHTCRRSFCTNEFLAGTPAALIMKISGHKSEKDFLKYIKVSPEEAALKIQAMWNERDNYVQSVNVI